MSSALDKILSKILKLDIGELQDSLTMDHVEGWDSLRHMDLITSVEEGLGVQLSGDEIVEMVSIGAIRRILSQK